jgi:hypothetical protein
MKKLLLTILLILTLLVSACSLEPASEKQIDEAIEELSDEDLDALMLNEETIETSSLAGQAVKKAKYSKSAATTKLRKKVNEKIKTKKSVPKFTLVPKKCEDTDSQNGFDETSTLTAGKVSYSMQKVYENGQRKASSYKRSDVCSNEIDLTEFYCDGNVKRQRLVACENGCANNACAQININEQNVDVFLASPIEFSMNGQNYIFNLNIDDYYDDLESRVRFTLSQNNNILANDLIQVQNEINLDNELGQLFKIQLMEYNNRVGGIVKFTTQNVLEINTIQNLPLILREEQLITCGEPQQGWQANTKYLVQSNLIKGVLDPYCFDVPPEAGNSIAIDCQNNQLRSNYRESAIRAQGVSNFAVENCRFLNFENGVELNNIVRPLIRNNHFETMETIALQLENVNGGIITSNVIERGGIGFSLNQANNIKIVLNRFDLNSNAIEMTSSSNNEFIANDICGSRNWDINSFGSQNNLLSNLEDGTSNRVGRTSDENWASGDEIRVC